jgi:hypothetical protein
VANGNGRGGRRQAPGRSAPSGPGRFSKRDERSQPIREPDIDNPDLQYGDRQMLTEGQRIAPLPRGSAAARGGTPATPAQPSLQGGIPPWLLESPSAFPEEPVTAGLDMGAGPGSDILSTQQLPPDVREQTLQYLANGGYGGPPNADAQQALAQLRNERARAMVPQLAPPPAVVPPTSPAGAAMSPMEPEATEQPPPEAAL